MTRYFLDTEFIEDGRTIDLISIGIVAEDGREFYAENSDADLSKASPWVKENVIPHLFMVNPSNGNALSRGSSIGGLMTHKEIGREVVCFMNPDQYGRPEVWGYYADYDWVVFCWLFGTMMDLPSGFPMHCLDIKQWCFMLGNPRLPFQDTNEHHALADARWNKQAWEFLKDYKNAR
jgi:3' exoribonuclease, RNase T-like